MQNKVELSMISTSSLPKVDKDTANRMLSRIKGGENELKDEFIKCNLRLVLSVVQKFSNRKENLDDIFQIGCVGLIKAIDNFDMSFGVQFSTYAVPTDVF
ncbi:MAG: sigma-70 family RNA polymerase sigma factor [Anaerofustis stercorihominis]|nr:sigma-70 family RNA polymerase sigma factor [Anaerofustis stercorihominis]